MCVLDFGNQSIDGEHELLAVSVGALGQQRPSVCGELIIPSSARPALYFAGAQLCETTDVTGVPGVPKRSEQVLERESGGDAVLHVALQHSTACDQPWSRPGTGPRLACPGHHSSL